MAETRTPGDTTGEEQAEEDQRDHDLPGARGLYDPRFEHDACGIGFVVDIAGRPSSRVIRQALTVLRNLDHRGARGAEPDTGDGAGILLQIPDRFLRRTAAAAGSSLPPAGAYGTGVFFLPQNAGERETCQATIDALVRAAGLEPLYWRAVPTDNTTLGASARGREPSVSQLLVSAGSLSGMALERRLYVIRRRVEKALRPAHADFYVASFSHRTLVYKGMLTPVQLDAYYSDLREPDVASALALVHARFSTNTFPSWQRAHPNRYLIHNGEINTLRGNINWMRAREALFSSPHFGDALEELLPVIDETGSDSAMFDNVLEFLVLAGRSLPHAIMMMIPEPWSHHESMDDARRAFYEYHSCLLEPWDGPAAIAFSDGVSVGAVLDRNGLRPARYVVTIDGRVIMASESGVLPIPPEEIEYKGRLQPGRMLLIDTARGAIVSDEELKAEIAAAHPYRAWLDEHLVELEALPPETESGAEVTPPHTADLVQLQQAHGYTFEDVRLLLAPMAEHGVEPVGSMGDDTPPALLSARPRLVFDYFKQLFAQVTNPPIDAIREALVMGSEILLGSEGNLLRPAPEGCRRIRLQTPVLTDGELARIRAVRRAGFRAVTLPTLFPAAGGVDELELALAGLCTAAEEVVRAGANLLILSDRGLARPYAAIPALLATGAVHHHLIRRGLRTRASLLVESGEPREVHHVATLLGYGAEAANPYLAFATIRQQLRKGMVTGLSEAEAERHYRKALTKGIVKTISKMGISTLQSYHGAQVFEALGLHPGVVDRYFTGTPSRIGGARLETIAEETLARHHAAFPERPANGSTLPVGGRYQWREDGEFHLFNPATVHRLQRAVRSGDEETYRAYAQAVDEQSNATLRSYLTFKEAPEPLPLEEVEPVAAILKRFKTGAMSFGSISREAHETLAIAMNRIGGRSNSGEGGEDPARYVRDENGDWRRSAIKQVASGRFGVTSEYLVNAEELQIKISQGAKPGEGGQLPGSKVYPWIARVRYSTPGVGLISPPPHHDIYSIEDLAQLIFDLKNANPAARVSVKLVSAVGVGTIAAGVAKGHADVILISGADGGTGASPQSSIKHAGLPWELGLAETQQTLVMNNLRDRVVLETDGQLRTGRDVAIAALLGAEEFGFATAPLVALGCIMMRVCHLDTCPVGIATQNPELRRSFPGDPQHIVNFMTFIAEDLRRWMARLGFRTVAQMVGRCDRLVPRTDNDHWKARGLDLSRILYQPATPCEAANRDKHAAYSNGHPLSLRNTLDQGDLLQRCRPALEEGRPVRATLPIRNVHRAVGTTLGSEVTRRYGAAGLPPDTIRLHFKGSAGQSFGAFVPPGLTLIVEGDTNDYLGKGLSGGRIIVFPPREATFAAEENVIAGNVAFYGATAGEAYIRGVAGERFCVRNSGAQAVVEGIGDHGCEYMTGGRVVVLGATGRNFAAGMSGGIAYVLDEKGYFASCCNREMVDLERLADPAEIAAVKSMIRSHTILTGSKRGREILSRWNSYWPRFYRVIPRDYRRVLETVAAARANGFNGEKAIMAAFDANKREGARASGN